METSEERIYKIQHSGYYFDAGFIAGDNQVIMGILYPSLVMLEFDEAGNFLNIHETEISKEICAVPQDILSVLDKVAPLLQNWQKALEFVPVTISIKQFFLEDQMIGIKDIPEHLQEVIDHPDNIDPDSLNDLQEDLRSWIEEGDFVFYWDNDYYLDREGEVTSS